MHFGVRDKMRLPYVSQLPPGKKNARGSIVYVFNLSHV